MWYAEWYLTCYLEFYVLERFLKNELQHVFRTPVSLSKWSSEACDFLPESKRSSDPILRQAVYNDNCKASDPVHLIRLGGWCMLEDLCSYTYTPASIHLHLYTCIDTLVDVYIDVFTFTYTPISLHLNIMIILSLMMKMMMLMMMMMVMRTVMIGSRSLDSEPFAVLGMTSVSAATHVFPQ